jgi:hypothetical protein
MQHPIDPIDLVQSIGISIQEANTARVEQDEPASAIRLLVYAEARLNDLVNGIVKNDIPADLWGGVYRALRIAFETEQAEAQEAMDRRVSDRLLAYAEDRLKEVVR